MVFIVLDTSYRLSISIHDNPNVNNQVYRCIEYLLVYIEVIHGVNVGIYSIHGAFGRGRIQTDDHNPEFQQIVDDDSRLSPLSRGMFGDFRNVQHCQTNESG